MNKKELIEKYENILKKSVPFTVVNVHGVLRDLKQLDEPEKVKIPQVVADWIKHSKTIGRSLFGAMSIFEENTEIKKWMQWADNQETFARAWLDGYEVEEEPKYIVKIKGVGFMSFLNHDLQSDLWSINNGDNGKLFKTHHTRKELDDADFGWVFDCEGIQIEEVE